MRVFIGPYPKRIDGKRKIKVKIDDYDVWSFDSTLAEIILPALKLLRRKKHGIPMDCFPPNCLKKTAFTDKDIKKGEENWNKILDAMIWSFNEIVNDHPGEKKAFTKVGKWKTEKTDHNTIKIISTGYKLNKKVYTEYRERLQHGLDLFGKHYQSLWT